MKPFGLNLAHKVAPIIHNACRKLSIFVTGAMKVKIKDMEHIYNRVCFLLLRGKVGRQLEMAILFPPICINPLSILFIYILVNCIIPLSVLLLIYIFLNCVYIYNLYKLEKINSFKINSFKFIHSLAQSMCKYVK